MTNKTNSNQLYQEIYSNYYNIITSSLSRLMNNPPKDKYDIIDIIREESEKFPGFIDAHNKTSKVVLDQDSGLLNEDFSVNLENVPTLPLTTIQKRWLKSLLLDTRIKLFNISTEGFDDIEPLFYPETIIYYDQFNNGDDYTNPIYIRNFRTLLKSIQNKQKVSIKKKTTLECFPFHLEYDSRDDKFRVIVSNNGNQESINLSSITDVELIDEYRKEDFVKHFPKMQTLELQLINNNDALNRCMIHFSDFRKETIKLSDTQYLVKITYDQSDERELIIRVLQFGTAIKVISPIHFKVQVKERIFNQIRQQ